MLNGCLHHSFTGYRSFSFPHCWDWCIYIYVSYNLKNRLLKRVDPDNQELNIFVCYLKCCHYLTLHFCRSSQGLFLQWEKKPVVKKTKYWGVGSSCLVSVNLRSRNNKGKGVYKFLSCWHLFEVPVIEYLQEKLFGILASFCMSGFYTTLPILQR